MAQMVIIKIGIDMDENGFGNSGLKLIEFDQSSNGFDIQMLSFCHFCMICTSFVITFKEFNLYLRYLLPFHYLIDLFTDKSHNFFFFRFSGFSEFL